MIKDGNLPVDDKQARGAILEWPCFNLVNGLLCHENAHFLGRCTAVSREMRESLIQEAHSGKFSGHFGERGPMTY